MSWRGLACKPTITLTTCPVVAFDDTGIDRLTDCGGRSARLHRHFRAADDLCGDFHHASPFPALDNLGIMQVRRGEVLGCGLGPTFAWDVQDNLWYPIHMQQGVSLVWQLITGKKRHIPTTNRVQALEEHVGVLLVAFPYHKGGHQAPCWCESDPHPGIALQREYFLGHGQMRFFLTPRVLPFE